ncbi:U-box domain-containing protein 44-like [Chenopodium quinoa]|uniref:U-box domain-containing protein 44-like n=1 Tax=Chenopodium quinoa TaxID=63459 RepID=UPI000B77F8B8|nr:U-box domain-containing protein 44-like [Chenopodium quinoa]XP_021717746.1 U-box domain-containing protein 44-like [Chenopodium quinoa]XP_021717747.1 U-box domain-containing protein 44-like [Chenopodium quinoa]
MAGSSGGSRDFDNQSDDSSPVEKLHVEPIFSPFVCPLTKQVMRDPVTIENGNTFEREAIEKWFRECKETGKKPMCPLTSENLKSTYLNPSIALRNTIEEWTARNEAAQLDIARRSLSSGSSERDILQALRHVEYISKCSRSNKQAVHNPEIVQAIVEMLRNSSKKVRHKALETLRVIAEEDPDMKEVMGEGGTVRTIMKFLSSKSSPKEKEEATSLLYELSKSHNLSEKIGSINGAILILIGMASSKSENILTTEKAHKTLDNLAQSEHNVRLMAESGRLQPLLTLLLEGPLETKLSMASLLGDLGLNNDVKVLVAETVGSALVDLMKNNDIQSREASLKALNQISSYDASAKVLIEAGILPPLVNDLFGVGVKQLPMRLKEVSATILSHVVNSGYDIDSVIIGPENQTLVSEDIIHNLLQLISNTGPSIECKLLQVLVGLTSYRKTVPNVVAAIKSSGATISLVQFIEERDLRLAAVKLLHNLSFFMAQELAEALLAAGQLGALIRIISENNGITEEQAAAVGLLAELPERDLALTRRMLKEDAFGLIISRVKRIRQGEARGGRFMTPYLEGLVRSLARITYVLDEDPEILAFCREQHLGWLFTDLLQANGTDIVQIASAWALQNLSSESKNLTKKPELPSPGILAIIFGCFSKPPSISGLCPVHQGLCSLKETFCLVEGHAVEKLVALLDHTNENVVEASLAALSTLLDDGVNIEEGVITLHKADGTKPILDILVEKRTEDLRKRAVWVTERLLRIDLIAYEISNDQNVGTALVDAFQHGDYRTKQIAERALKHVDRMPNFSGIFPNNG